MWRRNGFFLLALLCVCGWMAVGLSSCRPVDPEDEPPVIWQSPCDAVPAFSGMKAEAFADNVLRYSFEFENAHAGKVRIAAWEQGRDDTLYSGWRESEPFQHIEMALFASEASYEWNIQIDQGQCQYESSGGSFQTAAVPSSLPSFQMDVEDESAFEGHLLVNQMFLPASLFLLDSKGRICWYQEYLKRPIAFNYSPRGTFIMIFHGGGFQEIDLMGNVLRDWPLGYAGLDKETHHEVIMRPKGDLWFLTYVDSTYDLSAVGAPSNANVHGNGMLVLDSLGNKKWEWSMFDVMHPLEDLFILQTYTDWGHANSIDRSPQGDYLISFRDFSQVWKIDGQSGALKWKFGKGGDHEPDASAQFLRQHAAHLAPDGNLLLFDNGMVGMRETTRALAFDWLSGETPGPLQWSVTLPPEHYSDIMGNARILENGDVLLCSSNSNTIFVTDKQGNIRWEAVGNYRPYRAEQVFVVNR